MHVGGTEDAQAPGLSVHLHGTTLRLPAGTGTELRGTVADRSMTVLYLTRECRSHVPKATSYYFVHISWEAQFRRTCASPGLAPSCS
ncbi:hypothetical protein AB6A40_004050 [Gnathostoma spinigerum]|uniref:Uncharacterized protein n=1 Tax=Gnathostoma spinigerum TaxID=75299 RepID=A0ABD6EDP4_9BILA